MESRHMDRTKSTLRKSFPRNAFWRRVFKAGLLASVFGGLSLTWSVQAGIFPRGFVWLAPVLTNPAEESTEDAKDLSTQESRAISLLMYRDRDRERLLFHAQDQLMEGNLNAGLDYLQRILDFEEDLFIWRKSDHKLVSLRSEADRLVMQLDAAGFARYRRMADADAGALYKRAKEQADPRLYQEVTRRYFHTTHGFKATHWSATRWFDHGDFQLAARAWKSLEAHPYHRSNVTRLIRAKREMGREAFPKTTLASISAFASCCINDSDAKGIAVGCDSRLGLGIQNPSPLVVAGISGWFRPGGIGGRDHPVLKPGLGHFLQ